MEMKVTDQAEVTIKLGVDFFSCALRLVNWLCLGENINKMENTRSLSEQTYLQEVEAEVRSNSAAPRGMN